LCAFVPAFCPSLRLPKVLPSSNLGPTKPRQSLKALKPAPSYLSAPENARQANPDKSGL